MGDEANDYRTMLWENTSKIGAVELKALNFSNAAKIFVAPPLDTDVIARKKVQFVLHMMLLSKLRRQQKNTLKPKATKNSGKSHSTII